MPNNNHNTNNRSNPFSPQQPAQPEVFAGRKRETEYFRKTAINSARLKPCSPINYALLGSWGMGKTSLLYEFRAIALEQLRKEISCVSIYFPLSPQSCRNWDAFCSDFLRNASSNVITTRSVGSKIVKEFRNWDVSFGFGLFGAQRKTTAREPTLLEALENLWVKHLGANGVEIAFILLDDLHHFPIKAEESAYLNLRTVFQELVNRGCNYSLVVTANAGLFDEISAIAEPTVRFFKRFNLTPFTLEEAKEAVSKRLKASHGNTIVDDDVVEAIVTSTGGHPYLFTFSMFEMLTELAEIRHVTKAQLEQAWPAVELTMCDTVFAGRFNHATPSERDLMIELAKSGSDTASASELKLKGANTLLARLEDKELVVKKERGRYSLFHPLFASYLRRM